MGISEYKISLPIGDVPAATRDPSEAEVAWKARLGRTRLANLCAGINGTQLTPERLAWLNLWTRAWHVLGVVPTAAEDRNLLGLHSAQRAAQELAVHLLLLFQPIGIVTRFRKRFGTSGEVDEAVRSDVLRRMRGFTAWALMNDRAALIREERSLRETYDPAPAKELRKDPAEALIHEALFGAISDDTDAEHRAARAIASQRLAEQGARLGDWLRSPGLEEWTRSPSHSPLVVPSLGDFLGDGGKTMGDYLRQVDAEYVHRNYSSSSAVLHGSTSEELGAVTEGHYLPVMVVNEATAERLAEWTLTEITQVWLVLTTLRPIAWPDLPTPTRT